MLSDTEDEACLKEWANVEDQQLHNILPAGVHMVAPSLRFATTKSGGKEVDLGHYVDSMKEGQEVIYYALGGSMGAMLEDLALQSLQGQGLEVVLLPHPELCLLKLGDYKGKKFVSITDYKGKEEAEVKRSGKGNVASSGPDSRSKRARRGARPALHVEPAPLRAGLSGR